MAAPQRPECRFVLLVARSAGLLTEKLNLRATGRRGDGSLLRRRDPGGRSDRTYACQSAWPSGLPGRAGRAQHDDRAGAACRLHRRRGATHHAGDQPRRRGHSRCRARLWGALFHACRHAFPHRGADDAGIWISAPQRLHAAKARSNLADGCAALPERDRHVRTRVRGHRRQRGRYCAHVARPGRSGQRRCAPPTSPVATAPAVRYESHRSNPHWRDLPAALAHRRSRRDQGTPAADPRRLQSRTPTHHFAGPRRHPSLRVHAA